MRSYNVDGHNERAIIDVVKTIMKELGKNEELIIYATDRKGHDQQYAIEPTKIHDELGCLPETKIEDSVKKTRAWYLSH